MWMTLFWPFHPRMWMIFWELSTRYILDYSLLGYCGSSYRRKSFLDTLLFIEEGRLVFDGYRKATFSGRFFNFNSICPYHSICHKKGIIYEFINKIVRLCHPWFEKNNLINIINIFLNNG